MRRTNRRRRTAVILSAALLALCAVTACGMAFTQAAIQTDFARKDIAPCREYPFGTDWMGRDMFARTVSGLSLSIRMGLLTATVSAAVALVLGVTAAAFGRAADAAVSWVIDLFMGVPHILLLILISFACGKGFMGVVTGVTLTHWMSLARVMRGEVLQVKQSGYVKVAEKLGMSRVRVICTHMLPHLIPQFAVGLILLFPHAILHEASITFLGFGLAPEQPAIGNILSESMRYLVMGKWWLAVFPGAMLVFTVMMFDCMGRALRALTDPHSAHG